MVRFRLDPGPLILSLQVQTACWVLEVSFWSTILHIPPHLHIQEESRLTSEAKMGIPLIVNTMWLKEENIFFLDIFANMQKGLPVQASALF